MKRFCFVIVVAILAGCEKSNGPLPSSTIATEDPPPPYGLWLLVDTAAYTFTPDQVTFYGYTYDNPDHATQDLRPDAHTITITAVDSIHQFSIHMNLVDFIPGDYMLDGRQGFYYYPFNDFSSRSLWVKEPYQGYAVYIDSTGGYAATPDVLFTKLDLGRAVGQFNGFMTNYSTKQKKFIEGQFYK
jgi:hypothetical protein